MPARLARLGGALAVVVAAAACAAPDRSARDSPAPDRAAAPDRAGAPPTAGPIAIANVTVVDVATGGRSTNTVLINGDRIAAVGPRITIPPDAVRVDGAGRFLVPGFWDMHAHIEIAGVDSLDLFLANGVTGARDMGSDPDFILPLRDRISRGERPGPSIVAAGPILDMLRPAGPIPPATSGAPPYFALMRRRVTTAAEAREAVRDLKRRGVDFIKVHDNTPRDAFFAIADETRAARLPFAGHVPAGVTVLEAAESGIRSIEHLANFRVFTECSSAPPHGQIPCATLYDRLAAAGVWQTPTMAFTQAIPDLFAGQPLPHGEYASDGLLEATRANAEFSRFDDRAAASFRSRSAASLAAIRALASSGSGFLAGCDALVPGFCVHDELQWLTKAGFSPLQALQAATVNPARFLGRDRSHGAIAAGMSADLVLLDADPLIDIRHSSRIAAVIARGRLLDRADLDRRLDALRRGAPR